MYSRFLITHPKKTDQTITFVLLDEDGNPYRWDEYKSATATLHIAKLNESPFASISSEALTGTNGECTVKITNDNPNINSADVGEYVWWIELNYNDYTQDYVKMGERGRFILYAPNWVEISP